ncbi:PAS domain-containing protein [Stenotrophomonas sp. 169]|uniref:PAS domain-containing sensor histidine kinase n=1 Tax=unclassified Stenotrophomonas TaxID=196198 RepID=UPI0016625138|nr:PAS domain-containing sensor histidine kinase [Stenotrophomonas sp. 169]QNR97471.1 PAS domain-containing protein [Stenotrophomonas sp. 169]
MQTSASSDSPTVLIVAPFGRDAETIAKLVEKELATPKRCATPDHAAAQLDASIGAIVLTEEALFGDDAAMLEAALHAQPAWSDVPVVVLRAAKSRLAPARPLPGHYSNLVEVERPVGAATLISTIASALRARQKQYVIRDQVQRLSQNQETLARSEAELRLIADALPVLIAFVDPSLRYVFVNKAYEAWLDAPTTEIVGRRLPDILDAPTWQQRKPYAERALAGEAVQFSVNWPTRSGERRACDIRYLPRRDSAGRVDGFHIFVADVTAKTLALEAVQRQAEELEQKVAERTAELQAQVVARASTESALHQARKMESVGQLTGGIAHDFNNMLTGIISALDLIRMRAESGRVDGVERWIDVASASAHRAAALTQRLLAFSRRQSLNSQRLLVNELVHSLDDLMRRTLGEKIRLSMDLGHDVPLVRADSNQLESAILNLTINARDAMPQGGQLEIRTRRQVVEEDEAGTGEDRLRAGCYAVLSVTDTGEGIPPDVIERIFEPFFTTKPIGQGTGLGMSMIYGFMQQSDGHVRIDSEVGCGTTVRLYLPESVADSAGEGAGDAPQAPPETATPTGAGQQLLVVEDDAQVRTLVTEVLTELGYAVTVVEDGDAALKVLQSRRVDALVTDVGLPGLNGRQLAEIARQTQPTLPVLFMTGYAEAARDQSEFLEAGMHMIGKPFSLSAFGDAVAQLFLP